MRRWRVSIYKKNTAFSVVYNQLERILKFICLEIIIILNVSINIILVICKNIFKRILRLFYFYYKRTDAKFVVFD